MAQNLLNIVKRLEGKSNLERRRVTQEILEEYGLPYFKQEHEDGRIVNFFIDFAPKKPSSILVSGHYDAADFDNSPGAADNATSVAVIVDLADKLFMNDLHKKNVKFALFDQEEAGMLGSEAYIENNFPLESYVFNLEWVGDEKNVLVWPTTEKKLAGPYAFLQDAVLAKGGSFLCLPYPVIPTDADNFREQGQRAYTVSTLKDHDFNTLKEFIAEAKGDFQEAFWKFAPKTEFFYRYHSEDDTSKYLKNDALCFVRDVLYDTLNNYFQMKKNQSIAKPRRNKFAKWKKT